MAEGDDRKGPDSSPEGAADVSADETSHDQGFDDDAAFRTWLVSPATQARMRAVVVRRLRGGAPLHLQDDITQEATENALKTKSRPATRKKGRAWVGVVAAKAVANYFRRNAVHEQWLNREAEVEEVGNPPDGSEPASRGWLITEWLDAAIGDDERDRETYTLLCEAAQEGKTYERVAADHAMTEGAFKSRVRAFKIKYEPRWRRHRQMMILWILFGAAAAVGLVMLLWWLFRPAVPVIGPDLEPVPVPKPTPTATVDDPENRALPPDRPRPPVDRKVVP